MAMLHDIISNDFIDDRLTKFLNILQEPEPQNPSPVQSLKPSPVTSGKRSKPESESFRVDLQRKR